MGLHRGLHPDQKLENRELVLEQPQLQYRRPGKEITPLPSWAFITVRGADIAWMKVQYIRDGANGGTVPPRYKRSRALVPKQQRRSASS